MESKRKDVNSILEELIKVKVAAVRALEKINKISTNLKSKDRDFIIRPLGNEMETVDFGFIDTTISGAQLVLNATKGVSSGIGTALGTWALVSAYGTASTGAAIAGLSGAAATNATLAWLSGGSLAVGGGGVATGTAMLGDKKGIYRI